MLTKISATNYKSFNKLEVELAPITLFVGPNNSGKSSVISLLRLLSQTLESNDPNVRLLLNGSLGDFGTYKDLVFGNETRRRLDISFTIAPTKEFRLNGSAKPLTGHLHYKYRSSLKEIILKRLEYFEEKKHLVSAEFNEDSEQFILKSIGDLTFPKAVFHPYFDVRYFLPRVMASGVLGTSSKSPKIPLDLARFISKNSYLLSQEFQSLEHVGAMRVPPSRTFLYTGERRRKVGANGEHAITMLAMDSMRRGSKSKGIRQGVINWLSKAGIASDIKIVSLSDRYFEVHIQHPVTGEYQNFADVGYGNSQVIPVLVAGLNSGPGSVFIVEEPEIHLHPKAQSELADFFIDLHKRKIQSLVETHSEYLIVRLQRHIAERTLSHKDLLIYYVNPTSDGKELVKLELDRFGTFKTEWPGGFFPERLNEARELAFARSSISTSRK